MAWTYRVGRDGRTPPCPKCGNRGTVVKVRGPVYVCLSCYPYRSFEARWRDDEPESEERAS